MATIRDNEKSVEESKTAEIRDQAASWLVREMNAKIRSSENGKISVEVHFQAGRIQKVTHGDIVVVQP